MNTHPRTRSSPRNGSSNAAGAWLLLGLALLVAGVRPGVAADWALGFTGSAQYVEVPLGETLTMDNRGPRFLVGPPNAWTEAETANAWNGSSLQTTNLDATAVWTPFLPRAGTYDVYAWWSQVTSHGTNVILDATARYVVNHADGRATNVVNQNAEPGQWVWLGRYPFKADREEFVSLQRGDSGDAPTVADAVRFVTREAFNLTNALTLEAWVNVSDFDRKWQAIVTKGNAWGLTRYADTGRITFRTHDGASLHDLASSQSLETNRWYHVAAVYDGAQKTLYLDGAVSASVAFTASLALNTHPVLLGGNAETPSGDYFKGQLDNVRIWSLARSQVDLQTCSTNHLRGSEAGLLGDWRFDDSGLTTQDSAVGALHGLLRKSAAPPTRVAGKTFGPPLAGPLALRFDGYEQFVTLPYDARFDFTDRLTVETWVYFDFPPDGPVGLVSKGSGAWELALDLTGKLLFRTAGVTGPDPEDTARQVPIPDLISNTRLNAGDWNHVAAVWNGPAGRKDIYVNGQLDASATNLQGQIPANAYHLHFGARPNASGREGYFGGTLDEVRLWTLARTSPQISENFGRSLNRTEPGLTGFWNFDEGSGLVVNDLGPLVPPARGTMEGMMSNLNRVSGRILGEPSLLQYCLDFDGAHDYVEIGATDVYYLTNLTIEAWVKPSGTGFRNILMKGDHGYGLAIDADNHLRYFIDSTTQNSLRSDRALELELDAQGDPMLDSQGRPVVAWNHVAVVVDRFTNTTTFYINGKPAGLHASSIVNNNSGSLVLGKQGSVATANYYAGLMDEVRLWNVPRPSLKIDLYAFTPLLGTELPPGLIGYWRFNEGSGTLVHDAGNAHRDGTLVDLGPGDWHDGTDWGLPPLPQEIDGLTPDPGSKGLWVGHVTLTKVNEVQKATQGAANELTDTADAATIRILLHVAADGHVRMLKDVIIMKDPVATNAPLNLSTNVLPPVSAAAAASNLVLITRPELIPNYQGLSRRGGKLVGLRYGTAAYDFEGTELALQGGLGTNRACLGLIRLSKDHATNPYRHKYHPDHRSGFDILRQFTIQFTPQPADPARDGPSYGVDRLTGVYRETVTGLHKIPLQVQGTVQLDRIAQVGRLNE